MATISAARAAGGNIRIFRRDGAAQSPGTLAGDTLKLSAPRVEDRRSTLQVAIPPVVITAGVLGAIYGLLRTSWPIMSAGILGIAAGYGLRSAWNRLEAVPVD